MKKSCMDIRLCSFFIWDWCFIMAVPAHDERDNEFAKKFNLKIIKVIDGGNKDECYTGNGSIINSGEYDGIDNIKFKSIVVEKLENK